MHVLRKLLIVSAVAATAQVASAQKMGTLELGVFAHYTSVNNDPQLGNSAGFGGRAGLFLFRYFEVEAEYGRGSIKTSGIEYKDAWYPFRAFGTANIPIGARTDLLLGLGVNDTYKNDVTNNPFEDGYSALAGLRICFGDAWSVRPEVVYDKTPMDHTDFPATTASSTRWQFRVGLSRFIGRGANSCVREREHAPAPAPAPAPVVAAPPPPPAPTATLSATPRRLVAGNSSTLNWNSSNASTCSASWTSGNATSGSQSVSPQQTTTYSVSCSGSGGTTSASATIDVTEPPPPPAPTPTPVVRAPPKEFFRLSGVFFDFDKSTIKAEGKVKLDSAVMILNNNPTARIEIQGHTDSIGSDQYNMGLSFRRADAVRDYLISKGIAASRLVTKGYGESQPIAPNTTREGRAENRRVVLIEIQS